MGQEGCGHGPFGLSDVHFLEGCHLVASRVCRYVARISRTMADARMRGHLDLMYLKKIDLGAWPPDVPYPDSDPDSGEEPSDPEAASRRANPLGDPGSRGPWLTRDHQVIEAPVQDGRSKPVLFCSSCWQCAVSPVERDVCHGFRHLSGSKALAARNRLRSSKHPTRPGVSLGDGRPLSESTRGRWAAHFGEPGGEGQASRAKVPQFLEQGPPLEVTLQ